MLQLNCCRNRKEIHHQDAIPSMGLVFLCFNLWLPLLRWQACCCRVALPGEVPKPILHPCRLGLALLLCSSGRHGGWTCRFLWGTFNSGSWQGLLHFGQETLIGAGRDPWSRVPVAMVSARVRLLVSAWLPPQCLWSLVTVTLARVGGLKSQAFDFDLGKWLWLRQLCARERRCFYRDWRAEITPSRNSGCTRVGFSMTSCQAEVSSVDGAAVTRSILRARSRRRLWRRKQQLRMAAQGLLGRLHPGPQISADSELHRRQDASRGRGLGPESRNRRAPGCWSPTPAAGEWGDAGTTGVPETLPRRKWNSTTLNALKGKERHLE